MYISKVCDVDSRLTQRMGREIELVLVSGNTLSCYVCRSFLCFDSAAWSAGWPAEAKTVTLQGTDLPIYSLQSAMAIVSKGR